MVLSCARSPPSFSVDCFLGYLEIPFSANPFLKMLSAPLLKVLLQLNSRYALPHSEQRHSCTSHFILAVTLTPLLAPLHIQLIEKQTQTSYTSCCYPSGPRFPCTGAATVTRLSKRWMHKATGATSHRSHPNCTQKCSFSLHGARNLT